jgi:hypothetical protein
MPKCKVCSEKDTEIRRILTAYRKDKKKYEKVIICLIIAVIFAGIFGPDGVIMLTDIIKDWLV